jgi:hypothetical protein
MIYNSHADFECDLKGKSLCLRLRFLSLERCPLRFKIVRLAVGVDGLLPSWVIIAARPLGTSPPLNTMQRGCRIHGATRVLVVDVSAIQSSVHEMMGWKLANINKG